MRKYSWEDRRMGLSQNPLLFGSELTDAETRVVQLLVEGLQRKEIALRLNLSVNTVKTHLRSVFRKLGVHIESAAVAKLLSDAVITHGADPD